MRNLLASTAMLALLAVPSAQAPMMTISAFDDGVPIGSSLSATGFGLFTGADANFSLVTASATGDPVVPQPDLGSTTVDVSAGAGFSGVHTLEIDILQTGLGFIGPMLADTTMTFNGLIGAPGPAQEDMLVDGVVIANHVFPAGNGASDFASAMTIAGAASNEQIYSVMFTQPLQEFSGTMQFTAAAAVSEPTSLSLLLGAVGLGLVGMWGGVRLRQST